MAFAPTRTDADPNRRSRSGRVGWSGRDQASRCRPDSARPKAPARHPTQPSQCRTFRILEQLDGKSMIGWKRPSDTLGRPGSTCQILPRGIRGIQRNLESSSVRALPEGFLRNSPKHKEVYGTRPLFLAGHSVCHISRRAPILSDGLRLAA